VEAAGIEPASEGNSKKPSTCIALLLFYSSGLMPRAGSSSDQFESSPRLPVPNTRPPSPFGRRQLSSQRASRRGTGYAILLGSQCNVIVGTWIVSREISERAGSSTGQLFLLVLVETGRPQDLDPGEAGRQDAGGQGHARPTV